MKVGGGEGRLYTYRYTVTTRMTPALRWAMTAILMFHNCEGQSHKTVFSDTPFEEKREPKQIRTEVPLLTCLTPYRSAKQSHNRQVLVRCTATRAERRLRYARTRLLPRPLSCKVCK